MWPLRMNRAEGFNLLFELERKFDGEAGGVSLYVEADDEGEEGGS